MVWLDYVISLCGELLSFLKENSFVCMSTTTLQDKHFEADLTGTPKKLL